MFGLKIAGLADSAFVEMFLQLDHTELLHKLTHVQHFARECALGVFFWIEIYLVTANEQPSQLFPFRGRMARQFVRSWPLLRKAVLNVALPGAFR